MNHHLQAQIPIIAAYVQETAIYFLQFRMGNMHFTCIINIGLLVGTVVDDMNDAIAAP